MVYSFLDYVSATKRLLSCGLLLIEKQCIYVGAQHSEVARRTEFQYKFLPPEIT